LLDIGVGFLRSAIERIRGQKCDKLFQKIGNEINLTSSIDTGIFKINVANFSNVIKELVKVPDTAVALDDSQYLLCKTILDIKDNPKLKEDCIRIRLMIIIGFNQLRAILTSIKEEPIEELKKELAKWLRYMDDLHKHSISVLDPNSAAKDKAGVTLEQILEYQGIDENELQEGVSEIQ
jgi:hypothetical protein